jgi:hypothetical protein
MLSVLRRKHFFYHFFKRKLITSIFGIFFFKIYNLLFFNRK